MEFKSTYKAIVVLEAVWRGHQTEEYDESTRTIDLEPRFVCIGSIPRAVRACAQTARHPQRNTRYKIHTTDGFHPQQSL